MSGQCSTDSSDNLTAVLYGIEDIRLEQRPIPEPKENEVLLKMECVGICGSDVHYLVQGRIGHFVVTSPMIIGHEASGTVTKLGPNVKNLKIGDRVAIEPGVPCRMCKYCKEGTYNLCPDMIFCATPPCHGNLTRYYTHAADFCYKLPPHVSLEEGALMEPLSVGVHACKRAKITIGDVVVILGAGTIGLVTVLAAKAMGAKKIIITDIVMQRLELAKKLGADCILQVNTKDSEAELTKRIHEILECVPNKSIDCTGYQSTVRLAMKSICNGGVCVIVGLAQAEVQINLMDSVAREIEIQGVFRYCNDYPTALDLIASGKVDVKPLITHNYTIEETKDAFETARTGKGGAIKVMIHCNPNYKKE